MLQISTRQCHQFLTVEWLAVPSRDPGQAIKEMQGNMQKIYGYFVIRNIARSILFDWKMAK